MSKEEQDFRHNLAEALAKMMGDIKPFVGLMVVRGAGRMMTADEASRYIDSETYANVMAAYETVYTANEACLAVITALSG